MFSETVKSKPVDITPRIMADLEKRNLVGGVKIIDKSFAYDNIPKYCI